jgi:hypothetical protein
VIESMTGARFVHDRLEGRGWEVLVADAQKVKGLAPVARKKRGTRTSTAPAHVTALVRRQASSGG